jgi:capsule polysaccharide export protein KpsE/RkpR
MQEVDTILNKLIESIKTVDSNKSIPYLVKDIDKHVQEAYSQLYKYRESKSVYKPLNEDKRGHCC